MTKKANPAKSDKKGIYKKTTFQKYVEFRAIPEVFREKEYGFKTDTDFAKRYKINRATLGEWKKDPEYTKSIQELLRKWGRDKTPDVIAALLRSSLKEGKASEIKLWLEYVEEWIPGMVLHTPEMLSAIRERTELLRELVNQEKTKSKKL